MSGFLGGDFGGGSGVLGLRAAGGADVVGGIAVLPGGFVNVGRGGFGPTFGFAGGFADGSGVAMGALSDFGLCLS